MEYSPEVPCSLLDLAALDESSARAVADLIAEGQSANTLRSYRAAMRYWAAWFRLRYGVTLQLPASPATVIQFIVDHAERTVEGSLVHALPAELDEQLVGLGYKNRLGAMSLATINHRIAVLSQVHRQRALQNPCDEPAVRHLLARTRRAYAVRGVRANKKPALTHYLLQQLLATCDDTLIGKRDRALLLFAVASGGRRRSEVVSACVERLRPIGPGQYVFVLGQSKTDQSAQQDPNSIKPAMGDAGAALDAWLSAAGVTAGAIFRRIQRGGRVGEALNPSAVRRIVIERAKLAGLDQGYSAHSLRSGFLTEAGLKNVPLGEAMALSGHA